MSSQKNEEAIRCELDILEKEFIYLTGRKRQETREKYFKLLNEYYKNWGTDEPIYLERL